MASRNVRRGVVLMAALLALVLVGGCGTGTSKVRSSSGSAATTSATDDSDPEDNAPCPTAGNTRAFAKTRFALHAGLGLGAFHRYIYKPLKNGGFKAGADQRKRTFVKAAVAGVFTVHELKVAKGFAEANPSLCNAVQSISDSFSNLTDKLKSGTATEADIDASENSFASLQRSATSNGFGFDEKNVTVPGA
ncbi:hypothetical protein [Frankia sp. CiP3]|uniref:hypothetical protein n=1 Tax=Frankia sp. CiP3 TaxID=2880971 RepID=UPI001EF65FCD|nr:hypothetical protein [Frankia sp. CiP3]